MGKQVNQRAIANGDDTNPILASVVVSTDDPTKNGLVVVSADGGSTGSSGGGSSAGGGNNTYSTEQGDFTASITNATNDIVLSVDSIGGSSIAENHFLNGILKVYDASTEESVSITLDDFTWTSSTKTLDTTNCTNAFTFATGDIVSLTLTGPDKSYDSNLDINKVIPQANSPHQKTDYETLVTAQDLTTSYADYGAEIDCRTRRYLGLWVVYDVNDSDACDLKILGKYESAGADEFEIDGLSAKRVFDSGDSDGKIYYEFDTGTINYIQVQGKVGTAGATVGDLTIYINKYDV